jgi:hypothetical protein
MTSQHYGPPPSTTRAQLKESHMSQSLEDILNGGGAAQNANTAPQAAEVSQPAPPEPETEEPSQEASNPATGEDEATPHQAAPPAAIVDEPLDKKVSAFQRKAEDETRKRQDYERKLQEAEKAIQDRDAYIAEVRKWQEQQQAALQPEPDFYDPQQLQQYVHGIVAQERQAMQQNMLVQKVVTSQEFMRSRFEDYDELETVFAEEMAKDPSLQQKMWADPFPAKFAYEHAKKAKAMREIGDDPASFKERLRAELMAELQGQQPAPSQAPAQAKPVPQPPTSLAGVPSAARNVNKQPWKGPTPLDQLLN